MHDWESLSHVRWVCKYHIGIAPKDRQKGLYGKLKWDLGEILRDLCRQHGVDLLEEHLMPDHVHICLRVPPKHSIAVVIGCLKGKSAVCIHRKAGSKRVTGLHFWARVYCVSTVGHDGWTRSVTLRFTLHSQCYSHENVPFWGGFLRPPAMREELHSIDLCSFK